MVDITKPTVRINRNIKVPEVRVVDTGGELLGILPIREAVEAAEARGLDLVEVAPLAKPPVCKIMDYGKYKYEQAKKAHESKKNQKTVVVKEIKMRPATDDHDIEFKLKNARKFLAEGNKVKFTIVFRGRELAHTDLGMALLERVTKEMEEECVLEQSAKREGRSMFLIVAPKS